MIGLNEELEQREASGNPVRVGLIGAGQMGTDVVATTKMMKGVRVVVTADIDLERAISAYKIAQIDGEVVVAETAAHADEATGTGRKCSPRCISMVMRRPATTSTSSAATCCPHGWRQPAAIARRSRALSSFTTWAAMTDPSTT